MTYREEIYNAIKGIGINTTQEYPDEEKDFPCFVYKASSTANADHDGISFFDIEVDVEIYAETSEERTEYELKLQQTMMGIGYINISNFELPHPDYYRNKLTFESIR